MKSSTNPLKQLTMGRRGFLAGTALGIGAGLSTHAIASAVDEDETSDKTSDISLRDQDLPFIGTEETFSTHELMVLNDRLFLEDTGLAELGPRRIGAMDEAGLNVQILSAHTPGVQNVPGRKGVDFAYRLNKMLVDGPMAAHPKRFQAFATLPLQSPEASADELERTVREDGFLGCLTNGIIGKKFLDHPDFEPLLERAEGLDVPIYIHPGLPPDEVFQIYYSNMRPEYQKEFQDQVLSISAYGWHQEVVTQCLRMITSGVFDRHPKLQIIIGHMGEGLPFFYERIVEKMSEVTEKSLDKPFEQYFHDNFWFTTSAFPQTELLDLLLKYVSVDRVMFATDYPFANMKTQTDWFRAVALPREAKEKIAFRNAERLFGIKA
ncbi:putative TIM-barrel fold metal-dependent hydrolase [Streptomyces sp. SAI-117]|uniref:amidohydrolase family protein n=1 Tax=unclassified Streptomyces TaxID=2593676 RepID=UPI002472EAC8|nr:MULTISPECIES: amidohydrolase family protein [unclassified Streptomyces]MDH6573080.1 putative TIM-barrel fold metal-dependent hydrolase [Streptomyces sp. SAI-117]MDH6581958.1 putative TIM-barrel fold metal-dependent hydrolase [Streptomyces sp. SAI-133]